MKPTDDQIADGGELIERVELLLGSLTAVVSARVTLDEAKGPQVHIIATSEMPVSEVSRAVMSALTWGLGFEVPSNHITVVQSSLSREELHGLLGPQADDPLAVPVPEETPPTDSVDLEASVPDTGLAVPVPEETPPTDSVDLEASVPDTGLVEFSLGGTDGESPTGAGFGHRRLELHDFELTRNPEGGFAVSVTLADAGRSIGALREAAGTEEDSLEVPAGAALGVIQEFLRVESDDGANVVLRFLAARRLRHPRHDVIVVVVEAVVRGRRIPMTGAASANEGVERASILATLQATNAFVAGTLTATSGIP